MKKFIVCVLFCSFAIEVQSKAVSTRGQGKIVPLEHEDKKDSEPSLSRGSYESFFKSQYRKGPVNAFWLPLGSLFLPGIGQWVYGQFDYAAIYTGVGVGGYLLMADATRERTSFADLTERDPQMQKYLIGSSIYKTAIGMSSYHSFRTAVAHDPERFSFMKIENEERPIDLALAPFNMSYLGRSTSYLPLGILAGLFALAWVAEPDDFKYMRSGDVPMSVVMSYGAGVGEEAAFRGFLFPYLRDATDRTWNANLIQSGIFAALHISPDLRVPWPQFLLGYYFGWLTEKNSWQIAEPTFIHFWWDVIAILGQYAQTGKVEQFKFNALNLVF